MQELDFYDPFSKYSSLMSDDHAALQQYLQESINHSEALITRSHMALSHIHHEPAPVPTPEIKERIEQWREDFRLGVKLLKREGLKTFVKRSTMYLQGTRLPAESEMVDTLYEKYLEKNPLFTAKELRDQKKNWDKFAHRPTISIIVPVYNVEPEWLRRCIESVRIQTYPLWELCLHDDCSTNPKTIKLLKQYQGKDKRIKISFGKTNQHISLASNEAIENATGEFIGLLDNDDELTPNALYEVVKVLNAYPKMDFIYSDEDKISTQGNLSLPHYKSKFNPDLLLSHNYICHFSVIRKNLGDSIGWFRKGLEGSQDYDLFLRITQKTKAIYHIPKVLYHWRTIPGSTADSIKAKSYITNSSIQALQEHMEAQHIPATVEVNPLVPGTYRVKHQLKHHPLVSIVVPFCDKPELLEQLLQSMRKTDYPNYEIILVSNNSKDPATFELLSRWDEADERISWYRYDVPFNFSDINNWAVREHAKGELVLLLNNDIEIIHGDWLTEMVSLIERKKMGAVGCKLLFPNDTIQHAGIIMGMGGVAGHPHKCIASNEYGYFGRANLTQNLSGCTAACLLVKRSIYDEVGGLNEADLKIAFNDVDLCLKIRKAGYFITYTPHAVLYHHESISRGYEDTPEKIERFQREIRYMQKTWGSTLTTDPYYHPNFDLYDESFKYIKK